MNVGFTFNVRGINQSIVIASSLVFLVTSLMIPSSTFNVQAQENYVFVQEFAPNQQFGNPDITIDQSHNDVVYVADYFNNRIVKFDSSGNVITQWGSQGSSDGQFINPQDVGIDSAGFIYVVDTRNHRIQKFTDSGQFVTQWGSQGSTDGQFNFPDRIAIDTSDFIYVTDDGNGRNRNGFK